MTTNDQMEGVILAGGRGTRLRPLTDSLNKHLLDVGGRRMLSYPLEAMKHMGIVRVTVVTCCEDVAGFEDYVVADAVTEGMQVVVVGQAEPRGIADALLAAEESVQADRMCVMLGDQLVGYDLHEVGQRFLATGDGAMVLLKPVPDPQRFGVAHVEAEQVVGITEKPEQPASNLAVTGIYFYDRRAFGFCREIELSERGELEVTDVNCCYIKFGEMRWEMLDGWWADVGTLDSLQYARRMVEQYGANTFREG
ncbi:sugar phosphate nucleotidyltransferase [Poriferisphaera sp. WC338]|uniref:sugar phosphate nucleotidyltransferase n=1 Tax=Poriferisphaera sp. WC338 TaxID=3425129 RepID=UPI003D814423